MSPEAQRIAIAEACGWEYRDHEFQRSDLSKYRAGMWYRKGTDQCGQLPDYLNDLNAMRDAWCTLTPEQHETFMWVLADVMARDRHVCGPCRSLSNATAAQRAEAFLRTVGRWQE